AAPSAPPPAPPAATDPASDARSRSPQPPPAPTAKAPPSEPVVETTPAPPPPKGVAPVVLGPPAGLPHRLPYEAGDPVPSGYRVEERSNAGLMWGGSLMLSAAYMAAIVA